MGDPRNIAHAKKVVQEKHHKHRDASKAESVASRPETKAQTEKKKQAVADESATPRSDAKKPAHPADSAKLEKSLAVLSNLKELEFHSRANIEKLAELSLTIEEELKQKEFAEGLGAVYSAQDTFHSKIQKLIEDYETECTRLRPSG
jgi:hypothetical protein